jgi:hypothetical protein
VRWRALILAAVFLPRPALADGGTLRSTQAAGPFVISIFTAPEPLRVGSADLSVLVQQRSVAASASAVLLDATIELHVRAPDGGTQTLVASHATAGNRLMQAALLKLPAPGRWQLTVAVRHRTDAATISCDLFVGSAAPRPLVQWPSLALPPLCIALYVWRELLLRRRRLRR